MDRKSLVIGPRTRQDILKGKHIRKYEDGGDNFDDYWTDSDGESSISKDSEHLLELPKETPHIQSSTFLETSDDRDSNLRQRIGRFPLKSRNVQSPVIGPRTRQDILKGKHIRKYDDGGDNFDDYWTDSVGVSSISKDSEHLLDRSPVKSKNSQSPLKSRTVESPPKSRTVESPPKSRTVQSPSKSRTAQSPPKSRSVQSPTKSRNVQSPAKFKEVLPNDILNVKEVATEFQDITVNLGIDDDNPETSEIQNISNSTLSNDREENNENEMPKLVSRINFKTSKKSISRSTKKDPKIKEVQLQFDELDEKIMQMVHVIVSEDEMSLTEQSSVIKKKKSVSFKDIEEQENCSNFELRSQNESPIRSILRSTRSLNQNISDSESVPLKNMGIKRNEYTLEHQKDQKEGVTCHENDFIRSQCTGKKANSNSVPQYEKISSETFISKKNLTDNRSVCMDVSLNSNDDESHISSEQHIDTDEIQTNQQMTINKSTLSENDLNNPVNSLENSNQIDIDSINDLSPKITRQQKKNINVPKRNDPIDQHSSKTMSENSLSDSPNTDSHFENSKLLEDSLPRSKNSSSSHRNTSKNVFSDTSNVDDNISDICMIEKQKAPNEKNVIPNKTIHDAVSFHQAKPVKKRKTLVNKRSNSLIEENNNIEEDEVNIEKTTKKQTKIKNNKNRTTGKECAFMSHKDVEPPDLDSISQTSSRRKTRNGFRSVENNNANISLNSLTSSANNISGLIKGSKKQNSVNKSSPRKNKKSDDVVDPDEVDLETTDIDSLSHSQVSKKKNENNNSLRKTAKSKRTSSMLYDESITEAAVLNISSQHETTKKQKTSVNERNSIIIQNNDLVHASISSLEESLNNVNMKKTTKKQKKMEDNKKRHLYGKNNIEDKKQSNVQATKKSKSFPGRNNLDKENEGSVHAAIRKSKRTKYAPLAHWRNERLQYRFENGNITKIELDKGTKEDIAFLEQLNKQKSQKKKISKPKKANILDVIKNKEKRIHLLKKFPLVTWDSPVRCRTDKNPDFAFLIKRMVETAKNSFGYISINANKTKPPQYMPEEDLLLTVIEGNLEIHIQNDTFMLENKDMFIVPRGSAYSITNIGKRRALLSYAVGKFKFLESF